MNNNFNRLVYYIPGFDPFPPNRYRELYQTEGQKQAEISGYELNVKRISSLNNGSPRFQVSANIEGKKTISEFRFFTWNNLVFEAMNVSIFQSFLGLFRVGRVIAGSGALRRLMRLKFEPNIAGLYPFIVLPMHVIISALLTWLLITVLSMFITMPTIIIFLLSVIIFYVFMLRLRKRDKKLFAYYMLHDLDFICQNQGKTPQKLREKFEKIKEELIVASSEKFDEILIVGHSSGAHMGVIILAELIEEGHINKNDNFSFLTLGHAIPLVSYLPGASDLRSALNVMGHQKAIPWVDVTAPSDGCSFALCDPVQTSINAPNAHYPKIRSAAFSETLSDAYLKRLKWRFFRIHFQYLCHFDQPRDYDYFAITAGPQKLWERFSTLKSSPSANRNNLNGFSL